MQFKDWTDDQVRAFVKELETEKARRHDAKKKAQEAGKAPSQQHDKKHQVIKIGPRGGKIVKEGTAGKKAEYESQGATGTGKAHAKVSHVKARAHTPHHGVKVRDLSDEMLDKHLHEAKLELYHREQRAKSGSHPAEHETPKAQEQAKPEAKPDGRTAEDKEEARRYNEKTFEYDDAVRKGINEALERKHGAVVRARLSGAFGGTDSSDGSMDADHHIYGTGQGGVERALMNAIKDYGPGSDWGDKVQAKSADHLASMFADTIRHAAKEAHAEFIKEHGGHYQWGKKAAAETPAAAPAKAPDKPALALAPQTNKEALAAEARAKEVAAKDQTEVSDASRKEARKTETLRLGGETQQPQQGGLFGQPNKPPAPKPHEDPATPIKAAHQDAKHEKSAGHVGHYDKDGQTHELFHHEGDLYSAPVHSGIDPATGNRQGAEWIGMHEDVEDAKKELGVRGNQPDAAAHETVHGTFERDGKAHQLVEREGDIYSRPTEGGEEEWEGMSAHADKIKGRLGIKSESGAGGFTLGGQTPEEAAEPEPEEEKPAYTSQSHDSMGLFKSVVFHIPARG